MDKMLHSGEYLTVGGARFDVLKLILAVMIVGIHTTPVQFFMRPVFRIAVPAFFIMSSYFFFLKQRRCASHEERKQALVRYVVRILKLFFFWFVVLLPLTIFFRWWHEEVGIDTFVCLVRDFIFGSTFKGSWFLMASLLGVTIVWYASSKRVGNWWLIVIGALLNCLCCLTSSYYDMTSSLVPGFDAVYQAYASIFTDPYNSFPCALLYVSLGKQLADRPVYLKPSVIVVLLAFFMVTLYVEYYVTNLYGRVVNDDCYFSLPPLSLLLVMLVGQSRDALRVNIDARKARAYSTIIYCSHISIVGLLVALADHYLDLEHIISNYYPIIFPVTLSLAFAVAYIITTLEKTTHFAFLKYAH